MNIGQEIIDIIRGKNWLRPLIRSRKWKNRQRLNKSVIVLGDSHCSFFSGNEETAFIKITNMYDGINSCSDRLSQYSTLHLGPALAYNLNKNNTTTKAREKIEYLIRKKYLPPQSTILCCFGEIDLRVHILKLAETRNQSQRELIDNTLNNYIDFLLFLSRNEYQVYCWGAIATQTNDAPDNLEFPKYGDEINRNKATKYFNDKLGIMCKKNRIGFISIFDELVDKNYSTKKEFYSSDNCHLGQKAMELATPKLKILHTNQQMQK